MLCCLNTPRTKNVALSVTYVSETQLRRSLYKKLSRKVAGWRAALWVPCGGGVWVVTTPPAVRRDYMERLLDETESTASSYAASPPQASSTSDRDDSCLQNGELEPPIWASHRQVSTPWVYLTFVVCLFCGRRYESRHRRWPERRPRGGQGRGCPEERPLPRPRTLLLGQRR